MHSFRGCNGWPPAYQFAPNPHYLLLANPTVFTNQLTGISPLSYLELRNSEGQFMRSKEFAKYLEAEFSATKSIMTELGLAK